MKVKSITLSFPASDSPDVVGYKLYLEPSPTPITYSSPSFDIGNATSVDVSKLEGMADKDGVYNIGVTAVDDAGNESDFSLVNDVALDFLAPNPPGAIAIERL